MDSTNQNVPQRTIASANDAVHQVVEATLEKPGDKTSLEEDDLEAGIPVIRLSPENMVLAEAAESIRSNSNRARQVSEVSAVILGDDETLTAAAAAQATGNDYETCSDVDVDEVGFAIPVQPITPQPLDDSVLPLDHPDDSESCSSSQQPQQQSASLSTTRQRRAEFLSATVIKPNSATPLGLGLMPKDGAILISSIKANSLASTTPFRVGDRLLSVNHKRCYQTNTHEVEQLMARQVGKVTMVVHHAGGDPNYVESMVTRPSRDARCGLGLQSSGPSQLHISSIASTGGLFFDSLLNVGDPIVSINGIPTHEGCDAQDAADIIDQCGRYITIEARTLLETGVVVAAYSNGSTSAAQQAATRDIMAVAEALHLRKNEPSRSVVVCLAVAALGMIALLLSSMLH